MADPGLHIADACPVTGTVLKQHVVTVRLALRLEQKGRAAKQYSDHCVTLYTNGEKQHPLLVGTLSLTVDAKGSIDVAIPVLVTPAPPTLLLAQWYASAFDPADGISARELIAGGTLVASAIRLFDVENTVQGVLHTTGWPFPLTLDGVHPPVNPSTQALIQQVTDAYKLLRPPPGSSDKFSAVQMQVGDRTRPLPIAFYTAHATLMRADPAVATAYFENAIRLVAVAGAVCTPQLLADVLALPSLGWIYRPDVTRMGADADQWVSLHAVPHTPTQTPLAFDCEDGAKALMELAHVLQTITFVRPSGILVSLQQLAQRYVVWLGICELKSDDGSARRAGVGGRGANYLNHALVVLLRRDAIRDRDLPPVTLESTAYCSGAWTPSVKRTLAADEAQFARDTAVMEQTLASSAVDRSNARVKSAISLVADQQMYRRLLTLVSSTAGKNADRTQHLLLNVDMQAFLLLDGLLQHAVTAIDMATSELLAACKAELNLVPACRFPTVAPSQQAACIATASFVLPTASKAAGAHASTRAQVNSAMTLYAFH